MGLWRTQMWGSPSPPLFHPRTARASLRPAAPRRRPSRCGTPLLPGSASLTHTRPPRQPHNRPRPHGGTSHSPANNKAVSRPLSVSLFVGEPPFRPPRPPFYAPSPCQPRFPHAEENGRESGGARRLAGGARRESLPLAQPLAAVSGVWGGERKRRRRLVAAFPPRLLLPWPAVAER